MISQAFSLPYARVDVLHEYFMILFGEGNFEIVGFFDGHVHLKLPRALSNSEIQYIRKFSSNHRIVRLENQSINNGLKTEGLSNSDDIATSDIKEDLPLELMTGHPSGNLGIISSNMVPTTPSARIGIRLQYHDNRSDRLTTGLYHQKIETGETSNVYSVEATFRLASSAPSLGFTDPSDISGVHKLAIKRLHRTTTFQDFKAEYDSLRTLAHLSHPNIVETIAVFKTENMDMRYLNFVFPLAIGNLKRLFRGDYQGNETVTSNIASLWSQFLGLSSAVAHLHESTRTAHRDIKPSNILIYEEQSTGDLTLRLTDFGLAVDLNNAVSWERGSVAAESAWKYDSPDMRAEFPITAKVTEATKIPTAQDLITNDIWKLGCVFTELLAFLIAGGADGVSKMRDTLTKTKGMIASDSFSDTRFDDGVKVKSTALEWIKTTSAAHREASWLRPLLESMLAAAPLRPAARQICLELAHMPFSKALWNDGSRSVCISRSEPATVVTFLDKARIRIETQLSQQIDWAPLPPIRRPLDIDQSRVSWSWAGEELALILSQDEASRYKSQCLPIFQATRKPILPVATSPSDSAPSTSAMGTTVIRNQRGAPTDTGDNEAFRQPAQTESQERSTTETEMYWCIEKAFTEPLETVYRCITPVGEIEDNSAFFKRVNDKIRGVGGESWKGSAKHWLSWKRVTAVDFIKFHIIRDDWVNADKVELPLPPEYEHNVGSPEDIQMKLLERELVAGLKYPYKAPKGRSIIRALPKKNNPPPLGDTRGTEAWGLHAKMGLSIAKIIRWLVASILFLVLFAVGWLLLVSGTDVQSALAPGTVIITIFTLVVGLFQVLNK